MTPQPSAVKILEPASGGGSGETSTASPKPGARIPVPPRAPSSSKKQNKILLSVLDGKIEWEKAGPEGRKALEAMFRDPDFLKAFGLTGTKAEQFDPEQVKALFDAMSQAYQTIAKIVMRWPTAALQYLVYSDQQKNLMKEPAAKLLDRYAPALLKENKELFIFATVFFSCTQENFSKARAVANEEKRKVIEMQRARAAATPNATVVPTVEKTADGTVVPPPPVQQNGGGRVPLNW